MDILPSLAFLYPLLPLSLLPHLHAPRSPSILSFRFWSSSSSSLPLFFLFAPLPPYYLLLPSSFDLELSIVHPRSSSSCTSSSSSPLPLLLLSFHFSSPSSSSASSFSSSAS